MNIHNTQVTTLVLTLLLFTACASSTAPLDPTGQPDTNGIADDTGVPVDSTTPEPPANPKEVRAGVAERDVTPEFEPYEDLNGNQRWDEGEPFDDLNDNGVIDTLYLGGFTVRQPTGVADPLSTRALALELGDELFVWASIDIFGLSLERSDTIKARVLEGVDPDLGLTAERIIIASTHTHHAPDTLGNFGPDGTVGAWDGDYLDLVVERTTESILAALDSLAPAELLVASGEAGEGFVRDIDPPEIIDPYVGIIQLRALDGGHTIATAVSIANHPEAIWKDNTLISADYPGFLRLALEEHYGGKALFFAGALGLMQTPAEIGEAGFERAELLGNAYADVIIEALDGVAPIPLSEMTVAFAHGRFPVPLENIELLAGVQLDVIEGYGESLYRTQEQPCSLMGCIDLPIKVLRIGEHLTLITFPGEVTPELIIGGIVSPPGYQGEYADAEPEPIVVDSLETRERFIINLANAQVGYLFPKRTYDPPRHFSQRHGPGPNAAGAVMAAVTTLMGEVNAVFD